MKKRLWLMSLFTLLAAGLAACWSGGSKALKTVDITPENLSQLCEILKESGLSHVDVFEKWVRASSEKKPQSPSERGGFSDANCRMTVMLLAGDKIQADSLEENYRGDYMMFDLEAIENISEYRVLKDKEKLLTTLFGEMPISKSRFAHTLPDQWNKHKIEVKSDRYSIISVLFKVYGKNEAFVGHTGILINCRDKPSFDGNYLFLEKIAFGEPFKITWLKEENELVNLLSKRSDYMGEKGDPPPVVYKNMEILGILKSPDQ